jgi:hypothetical protein
MRKLVVRNESGFIQYDPFKPFLPGTSLLFTYQGAEDLNKLAWQRPGDVFQTSRD